MKPLMPKPLAGPFGKKTDALKKAIDRALLWLDSARKISPRLDMEADQLSVKLYRQHNKAMHLANAAVKECAIGLFGLSQAGKSWLINALAVSEKGRLELALGAQHLDYSALNPQQVTGTLVQRLTGQQTRVDNEWPVQLSLLSEDALITIIVAMHASHEAEAVAPDEQQIGERLKAIALYRQPQAVGGLSHHDVVALWDRVGQHHIVQGNALETHFWPQAVELAPMLSIDDRARLFSLLWHDESELTALYRQMAHILALCPSGVLAPVTVLDDPSLSILNTNGLRYFNTSRDRTIPVMPQSGATQQKPVNMTLAELTLLSREVLLPFYSAPREPLFEQVDLLDYPGMETPSVVPDDKHHALALAFITAKRPFLLTHAAERQESDLLLVCSAAGQRADARTVGSVLDNWVKQTQGESGRRKPGLIWTLTPFDQRITRGENFDAAVQRFVGTPGEAWGTMLAMDDKGVKRMAGWLVTEIRHEVKLERLDEQREELRRELSDHLLGRWRLVSDKEEPEARLRIAETLLKALQTRTGVHGELLERLLPDRETLRHLFLQRQPLREPSTEHIISEEDPFGIGVNIDLLSDEPMGTLPEPGNAPLEPEVVFARQVYRLWVNTLRQLPDRASLLTLLGVSKTTLEMLAEEMVTASIRLEIESALINVLNDREAVSTPLEAIADRQVSRAMSILGDFVAWLGFQHVPDAQRPDSKIHRGQKIFAKPAATPGPAQRLTRLALKPNNHAAFYIYDWLVGLNEMILQNAGWSAAREIDSAHRSELTAILKLIAANKKAQGR